jgi:pimeloyl-ACP methyl ester carboxylesterase
VETDVVPSAADDGAARAAVLDIGWRGGTGTPLVLLHDVGRTWQDWEVIAEILSDRYTVIAVDLLGFGASPSPPDVRYALDDHVAALHATLRPLLQGGSARIAGHSLGALVALGYAAEHPEDVEDVVMVAPPVMLSQEQAVQLGVEPAGSERQAGADGEQVSDRLRTALVQRSFRRRVSSDPEERTDAASLTIEHAIGDQDVPGLLARASAPVTIVYGTRDPVVVAEHVEALARADSGIDLHALNAAHDLLDERPAAIIARIAPEIGPDRLGDLASQQHRLRRRISGRSTARRVLSSGVGTLALRGLAALFSGLALIAIGGGGPEPLAAIVAVYLLIEGALLAADASRRSGRDLTRIASGALAAFSLAAGALMLIVPSVQDALLLPALAIRSAAVGTLDVYSGTNPGPGVARRWLLAAEGGLSLVLVLALLATAGSDELLVLVVGLYFAVSGLLLIGQTVASELALARPGR